MYPRRTEPQALLTALVGTRADGSDSSYIGILVRQCHERASLAVCSVSELSSHFFSAAKETAPDQVATRRQAPGTEDADTFALLIVCWTGPMQRSMRSALTSRFLRSVWSLCEARPGESSHATGSSSVTHCADPGARKRAPRGSKLSAAGCPVSTTTWVTPPPP